MQEDVFQAALAGLWLGLSEFAQAAAVTDRAVSELIPAQWRSIVQPHLEQIVTVAARLAAGGQLPPEGRRPAQLRSIFGAIQLRDEQQQALVVPQGQYLPLKELNIQADTIFPVGLAADTRGAYQKLWQSFVTEANKLKAVHENSQPDPESYLHSLLRLMQRYGWSIPSTHYSAQPDVSIYDHSRITSALAACLAGQAENGRIKEPNKAAEVALLVGGDISGVQKFIYTITSRGATSALRGRSMYLQLLTEVVARYVLREIGMPLTNLIYAGGGHFYLLAPLTSQEKLHETQRYISRVLLYHHQGDLYLALAHETLHADEFQGKPFSDRWRSLTQKLQLAKQRQFSELGPALADLLFAPQEHGGNEEKLCVVCQREHPDTKAWEKDEPIKCPACHSFEILGKDLRQARYLCLDEVEAVNLSEQEPVAGAWPAILAHFGYQIAVSENTPSLKDAVIRRSLLVLEDEALRNLKPQPKQAISRHFLVNVTPILTFPEYSELKGKVDQLPAASSVKPFEVLAEQSTGIKRLGILRMDVDSLGQIFSRGLGTQATLSRVAALSFAMSLFFEGWVERIAGDFNQKAGKDLIYSIYSGGDDLFMVGAWHLMPSLAERINQDLSRYTGHHPGIHVSGGIALADGKYPLYQAAADAHEAEQAAKANQYNGSTKNALNFLDKTIPWVKFAEVQAQQHELADLVTAKKAPKALLQRLNQLYAEYDQANRERARRGLAEKVYWGPWHWHSAYILGRLAEQNKDAREEIKKIRDELSLENFKNIEWIGLAARWAELLVRGQ